MFAGETTSAGQNLTTIQHLSIFSIAIVLPLVDKMQKTNEEFAHQGMTLLHIVNFWSKRRINVYMRMTELMKRE